MNLEAGAPGGLPRAGSPFPAHALPVVLLLAVAVLPFLPALRNGWIWDDDLIHSNPLIRTWGGLWTIWTVPGSVPADERYWPVFYTALAAGWAVWGASAVGFHAMGIAVHALNALLLRRLLVVLAVPGAWLGAALWAVHPMRVESVVWAADLKTTLSTTFVLMFVMAYLRWARQGAGDVGPGRGRYIAAVAWFALGLLTKATALAALPTAWLLLAWLRTPNSRRWLTGAWPMALMSLAIVAADRFLLTGARKIPFDPTWSERARTAATGFWFYLWETAWPWPLLTLRLRWDLAGPDPWGWMMVGGVAAGAVACAITWRRGGTVTRGAVAAVTVYAVNIAPVSGIVPFSFQILAHVADRYSYAATMPVFALAGAWAACVGETAKIDRRGAAAVMSVALVWAALSFKRSFDYRNLETLWRADVAAAATNPVPRYYLAQELTGQGRLAEAIGHFATLDRLQPAPDGHAARLGLGALLVRTGETTAAVEVLSRAVAESPRSPLARLTLGQAWDAAGQMTRALPEFEVAASLEPRNPMVRSILGTCLAEDGQTTRAAEEFAKALLIEPGNAIVRANLQRLNRHSRKP